MARKIGILEGRSETPKTYVKKTVAALLVRRQLAIWVIQNMTIRRIEARDVIPAAQLEHRPRTYIPDKLPPNLDARMGLIVQVPALPGQVRFRAF